MSARPRRAAVALGVVVLAAAALAAGMAARSHRAAPARHPNATRPVTLGATPRATQITFALSLRLRERALDDYLKAAGDPQSPLFGETLTAAEIGRRFGVPLSTQTAIRRRLAAAGISVLRTYPQRTEIDVRASVATLDRFFHVRYADYRTAAGVRFHAPRGTPQLPRWLASGVSGVVGLSTQTVARPADVRGGHLTPADAALAYDIAPLREAGIDGKGLSIAIISFQQFLKQDVEAYDKRYGIHGPFPKRKNVTSDGAGDRKRHGEADLDVEVIHGLAPGAQITSYEASGTVESWTAAINKIVASKTAIASLSYGIDCDAELSRKDWRDPLQKALKAARARGVTIFVASGDDGAYDCQSSDLSDHTLSVDFPADSPHVVSVGGTTLSVDNDGTYLVEYGWDEPMQGVGGGGGIDPVDARPSWQAGVGDGKHRVVPDVSANANWGNSAWATIEDGEFWSDGGTSAAAPFWAAAMLLAQQYAQRAGVRQVCFLSPLLYQLAARPQPYPPFHDVTIGSNRYYQAGSGWDYATGLGSPDVYNLARDLVAGRQANGGGCNAGT